MRFSLKPLGLVAPFLNYVLPNILQARLCVYPTFVLCLEGTKDSRGSLPGLLLTTNPLIRVAFQVPLRRWAQQVLGAVGVESLFFHVPLLGPPRLARLRAVFCCPPPCVCGLAQGVDLGNVL